MTSIRGVAALWVASGHAFPGMFGPQSRFVTGSYTAVDLFFILSGMILATIHADLGVADLPRFALKRLLRIYPMCFFALTFLICVVLYPHVKATVVLAQYGFEAGGPIFAVRRLCRSEDGALIHPAWSAGIEMVCYSVFPFALWTLRRLNLTWLAVWFAACAVMSWWIWHDGIASTIGWGALARGVRRVWHWHGALGHQSKDRSARGARCRMRDRGSRRPLTRHRVRLV